MYRITPLFILASLLLISCTEKNTYVLSPEDWQPPVVSWRTQVDAEVRGTVGVDFQITDSSEIAQVIAYLDGAPRDSQFTTPYRVELITDSLLDGVHLLEIRATDEFGNLGISPILRINVANSVAQGPQLIWVPDHYTRIQDAINAATDFDTIRVRDGVYYESLNLFGKGIWLESENGPLQCNVDSDSAHNTVFLNSSRSQATIRGLTVSGASFVGIELEDGAFCSIYNNILLSRNSFAQLHASRTGGDIRNNLFAGGNQGIVIWALLGDVVNNILVDATDVALWNSNYGRNPVVHSYNLYWSNEENYFGFQPGIGDVEADPMLDLSNGELMEGSPCFNNGHPDISDRNGSRSDIGPFGGPFAYQ
jgi:hypothetical protein